MNTDVLIHEEPVTALAEYGVVPIAFTVRSRFRVLPVEGGLGGLRLIEERVEPAWVKDYDAAAGEQPTRWARRWDIGSWGVLAAFAGSERVGGAAVAWNTEGVDMLEGRRDLAVLWDLRVRPEWRGRGAGRCLFERATRWARDRGCRRLKIETQDVNVPACRFYARQGCALGGILLHAYSDYPDEAQLLWYLDL